MSRAAKWFNLVLLLSFVGFAEALSWITSDWPLCLLASLEQPRRNDSGHQTCATLFEGIGRAINLLRQSITHDDIAAAATVVIAIFTATLWFSTHSLWKAGQIHSEKELRAYLLVTKANIGIPDGAPSETIINLTVRNFGQTPAYKVTVWADMLFDRDPLRTNLIGTKNPKVGETIYGPNGKQTTSFYKTGLRTDQRQAMFADHGAAIYVWGEVRYVDAFNKKRCTKFRAIQRGGPEFRDKPMAFCNEGNEAT